MMMSSALLRNQMYSIELRHLSPAQQAVIGIWLDLIPEREMMPTETVFYQNHYCLESGGFFPSSPFANHKDSLIVVRKVLNNNEDDWEYIFRGAEISRRINEDTSISHIRYVSQIENHSQRELILDDFEALSRIQKPYHLRLIWRPYSGYFGHQNEHKVFVRVGLPLSGPTGAVDTCLFLVNEAPFGGRAIIELS